MTYLKQAIKDGYAYISGTEDKQKITYVTSHNFSEKYNAPEEKVRAEFWAELIYKYEYPANRIKLEVTIPDRLPTNKADIVVFSDDDCTRPYAVVECKKDGITDAEFLQAIEQGVGNATWIKLRAAYSVTVAGSTRRVLDVSDKYGVLEREKNIVADLPKAYGKPQEFRFYKGTENDIKSVAREDLIATIKKCHQTLWGGGRLSPPTAFGELCKLIFVKISDEQKPRKNGEPYQFQIKTHEPSSKLAERINALYNEQKVKDPEVFTESIKVDDRVLRTVVSHLEAINLNKTDLDVKGVAFEQFMDGFFKGDFGQYFTPRPIIEFCVNMMKPQQDWDVLDPSCGSGGFLLHALDYMRKQAGDYYEKGTEDYYKYWHDFAAKHLFGIEINDEIARVAKMNMIVHDDGHTNVISHDALESIEKMHDHNRGFAENRFDLILTNPPFGATINLAEKPYLTTFELGHAIDAKGKKKPRKNQSSEVLFIERIWQFLKPGTGKAAIVLPDGILTNSSMQYVRDFILENFQLLAVVSLPQCAFAHFGAGVKASVIFVRKRGENEKPNDSEAIFMAAPELIGYDATGRKTESQLDEIVEKWEEFQKDASEYLFDALHLYNIIYDDRVCCAVTLSTIMGDKTFSAQYYHPERMAALHTLRSNSSIPVFRLSDVVSFCRDIVSSADNPNYLGLAGVESQTGELSGVREDASGQAFVYEKDDILYGKLRPYLNKVIVAENSGICSTEFHVMKVRDIATVLPEYVAAILRSDLILSQTKHMMTGNTHPRISNDDVQNLYIPIPDITVQQEMVNELKRRRMKARRLKMEAEQEWQEARKQFENALWGK